MTGVQPSREIDGGGPAATAFGLDSPKMFAVVMLCKNEFSISECLQDFLCVRTSLKKAMENRIRVKEVKVLSDDWYVIAIILDEKVCSYEHYINIDHIEGNSRLGR
jgi:hypothetical protein